jgi:hypothetical protein
MAGAQTERRAGGRTVIVRIVLDRPPDQAVLHAIEDALRDSDNVVTSPGFEVEVRLLGTTPELAGDRILPRVQRRLEGRTIRLVQIDGEDVLVQYDE